MLRFFRGERSSQPFTLWEAQQSLCCLIYDSWWVHKFYSRWAGEGSAFKKYVLKAQIEVSISCTVTILKVHLLWYLGPVFGKLPDLLLALGIFCIYLYIFFKMKTLAKKHKAKILKFHCSNVILKKITCIEVQKIVKRCQSGKVSGGYIHAI